MRAVTKIAQGELRGREREGALLFAGIPFAEPPLGERRFRPPELHAGWSSVRDAQRFGKAAPQWPGEGLTAAPLAWDEDCLTLNVTTPAVDDAARPVLFWIHGGGFRTGKGGIPWYDGSSFARRGDVVTVSLNYRLGALGFAHLADLDDAFAASGVNGILDQIAALEWVRDNIAAFGGDPGCVTIAGESAGAMSVGTLLGAPRAAGLFRRAIAQSGAAHHVLPDAQARAIGRELAAALGAERPGQLAASPVDDLLAAQDRVQRQLAETQRGGATDVGGMAFVPAVEGGVLPRPPLEAVRAGLAADVDLLVGSNRHETTLWGHGTVDEARLRRIAARRLGDGEAALARYRRHRPDASPHDLVVAIETDYAFRIPAIRLAEAHVGSGGRSYSYLFDWRSRAYGGRLGATHALEIPFAFHTLDRPGVGAFLGPGPPPTALADAMHAAWTAFVRSGDPSCDALPEPWPRYDTQRRGVMRLGDEPGVVDDPDGDERRLWEGRR